jgi:hypothetical protein
MTRDDVMRMAREAGYGWSMTHMHAPMVVRFAELVVAAEREACAKFVEDWSYSKECAGCDQPTPQQYAQAIRARGEP